MNVKIITCLTICWFCHGPPLSLSLTHSCSLLFSYHFQTLVFLSRDFSVPETKEVVIHKYKTPMVRWNKPVNILFNECCFNIFSSIIVFSSPKLCYFLSSVHSGTSDLLLRALSLLLRGCSEGEGGRGQTQDAVPSPVTQLVHTSACCIIFWLCPQPHCKSLHSITYSPDYPHICFFTAVLSFWLTCLSWTLFLTLIHTPEVVNQDQRQV